MANHKRSTDRKTTVRNVSQTLGKTFSFWFQMYVVHSSLYLTISLIVVSSIVFERKLRESVGCWNWLCKETTIY